MADNQDNVKFFGSATDAATNNTDPFFGLDLTTGGAGFTTDPFWSFAFADDLRKGLRWNKLYPFQLLILKKKNGTYSLPAEATFTLPIPPQDLTVNTPFAINTSVTMGGILEEHNGAPLRNIGLRGTTGVLPLRGTVEKSRFLSILQETGVFGGTLQAVGQIQTAVQQFSNVIGSTDGSTPPNVHTDSEFAGDIGKTTGYYQMMLLQRFLESYITQKKTAAGRDLRLAFAVWKEQAVYLVTPVVFDVIRSAASPMEYSYSLQLKAWRRITLEGNKANPFTGHVGTLNPNKFAALVNTLETARRILQGAQNVLKAVRADIQNTLFTPLREAILFAKDTVGVATSISDFPSQLTQDLTQPLLEMFGDQSSQPPTGQSRSRRALEEALKTLAIQSGKASTKSGLSATSLLEAKLKALSGQDRGGASPASKAINNPDDNFEFFSEIKVGDLNLRPGTVRKIEDERRRVRLLRREDFERSRDNILRVMADFSDFVGAGSTTYTTIYQLPARVATKTPTDDDWEVIHSLSSAAQALDVMAVSSTINKDFLSSIDFVAGLASRSGIAFRVPQSKFAVPFPYGYTLEQLSDRYLNTPDRWHEIAALNGLKVPYVDEIGFEQFLLVNGNGNQVMVGDGSRFFSGQPIFIGSTTVRRERRRIQRVEALGPAQFLLVLDGAPDLQKFTTVAQARVQAFLPDTVNSQMQIFIPSDTAPEEEDFRVKSIPGVDYFDPLIRTGGVDLLLTGTGDLVITPDGDCRLAVGLTNLIQKVRLALGTPRGSLLHHREYGFGIRPGTSTADISAQDVLSEARQLFRDDPGFTGVEAASVRKFGNGLQIGLGIGIAGTSQVIPVQVQVRS